MDARASAVLACAAGERIGGALLKGSTHRQIGGTGARLGWLVTTDQAFTDAARQHFLEYEAQTVHPAAHTAGPIPLTAGVTLSPNQPLQDGAVCSG